MLMNIVIFSTMFSEVVFTFDFDSLNFSDPVYESENSNSFGLTLDTELFWHKYRHQVPDIPDTVSRKGVHVGSIQQRH